MSQTMDSKISEASTAVTNDVADVASVDLKIRKDQRESVDEAPAQIKKSKEDTPGTSILKAVVSPAKKHKKKRKDVNAPQKPLNGYVLFLNKNRLRVVEQNPGLEFADITKKLATEWSLLSEEEKKPFLTQAEEDRQRYRIELQQYKASDAFRTFQQQQSLLLSPAKKPEKTSTAKKRKIERSATSHEEAVVKDKRIPKPKGKRVTPTETAVRSTTSSYTWPTATATNSWCLSSAAEIPIFTDSFLEHNKIREIELRKLRKLTNEFEEQNAILSKHIDKMKAAEAKLKVEMTQMAEKNCAVEAALNRLKGEFVSSFSGHPIPGTSTIPTLANVCECIDLLHQSVLSLKFGDNKQNKLAQEKMRQILKKFSTMDDLCPELTNETV